MRKLLRLPVVSQPMPLPCAHTAGTTPCGRARGGGGWGCARWIGGGWATVLAGDVTAVAALAGGEVTGGLLLCTRAFVVARSKAGWGLGCWANQDWV
jgi:hypothetical protein